MRFLRARIDGEREHVYWIDSDGVTRDLGRWVEEDFRLLAHVTEQAHAQGLNKRRVTVGAVTRARGMAMKLWSGVKV